MSYNSNIPLGPDKLSVSQLDLLNNMQAINDVFEVDHVDFNAPGQGKHFKVSLPVQAPAPTFEAGDVGLYSFGTGITGQNELFINKINQATVTQINASGSILSNVSNPSSNSEGWSFLPSGILIKWGRRDVDSTVVPLQTISYPTGPNIPVFTKVFSVQLSTYSTGTTDPNKFVTLIATGGGVTFPNADFSAIATARSSLTTTYIQSRCQYLAIGIGGF